MAILLGAGMIDGTFIETRALVVLWPHLHRWVISEQKVNGMRWPSEVVDALPKSPLRKESY